jgi:hypothetical protein
LVTLVVHSVDSIVLRFQSNVPVGSTVSGVPGVQESVVVTTSKVNGGVGRAENRSLFIDTSEEVIASVKSEASLSFEVGRESSILVHLLVDNVNIKSHRLFKSVFDDISCLILKVLELVGNNTLVTVHGLGTVSARGVCARSGGADMSEVSSSKGSLVEGLEDRRLTHIHSILHRELEVLVSVGGMSRVEEGLQTNCFIKALYRYPRAKASGWGCHSALLISSASPKLLIEPSVGRSCINLTISIVNTADSSDIVDEVSIISVSIFSSSSEERVGAASSGPIPLVEHRSHNVIYHQVSLERANGAHVVKTFCSCGDVSFDKVFHGVGLGEAAKGKLGNHP